MGDKDQLEYECVENCTLMEIPLTKRIGWLLDRHREDDLYYKVYFLSRLEMFKPIDDMTLVELARNIQAKTYKYTEILLKESQPNDSHFYIVIKGKCCVRRALT